MKLCYLIRVENGKIVVSQRSIGGTYVVSTSNYVNADAEICIFLEALVLFGNWF